MVVTDCRSSRFDGVVDRLSEPVSALAPFPSFIPLTRLTWLMRLASFVPLVVLGSGGRGGGSGGWSDLTRQRDGWE